MEPSVAIVAVDITISMQATYFSLNTQGQQGAGLKKLLDKE